MPYSWSLKDSGKLEYKSLTARNDECLSHMTRLYDLESLTLNSAVTDAGLVHLKGLVNLKELLFSSSPISDAGLLHLRGLTNLKQLSLQGSRITGSGLTELAGLANLETLNLAYAPVKDDELAGLASLTRLRVLDLANTPITDAGLVHIRSLKNLETVHLGSVLRLMNRVSLWYVWRYCCEPVPSDARVMGVSPCRKICRGSAA